MDRNEKIARLKEMVRTISQETDVKALTGKGTPFTEGLPVREGLESFSTAGRPFGDADDGREGVEKMLTGREADVTDAEVGALEAIVLKQGRPAVFIRNDQYDELPEPWTGLNGQVFRRRLQPLFPSIGRVELPNSVQIPYGGTGFVVGADLLMTNRHVAELFTHGLGDRGLVYRAGNAAVDFKREYGRPEADNSAFLTVRGVVMIHPYWDMALLRVDGLAPQHLPLTLSVHRPEDMVGQNVAAVGYPARDPRSELDVQDRIFNRIYDVKRFLPGKLRARDAIKSFEHTVSAATHDSSTLGGNSGSAVINLDTGEVVGLHFAGVYLKANYAVPTYELARDTRVVEAGVNFNGRVAATAEWDAAWAAVSDEKTRVVSGPRPSNDGHVQAPVAAGDGAVTWTIPIHVTVALGTPTAAPRAAVGPAATTAAAPSPLAPAGPAATEFKMQAPFMAPDLESRKGYQPDFLDADGEEVPLPTLTPAGRAAVAKLEDGSTELKYHHFSVVMNKKRRLALFTASNVDWRPASRQVNGRKPSRRELTGLDANAQELWVPDPRIPANQQLPDVFFTKDNGAFDKGHIVRRDDVAWGATFDEMRMGNGDTYHTTNCSPQVAGFNRSAAGEDNWGDLENLVQKETKAEKVCIFSGPVLSDEDKTFNGRDDRGPVKVQIPRKFWKVVVAAGDDGLKAYGFVLEQDLTDVPLEFAVPRPWRRYMVSIADIEQMLNGLARLTWLKNHDAIGTTEAVRMADRVRVAPADGKPVPN